MDDNQSASDTRNPEEARAPAGTRQGALANELPWAIAASVLTAAAVFVAVPDEHVPLTMVKAVLGPGVQAVELHGGVRITYRAPGPEEAVAQAVRILEHRAAQVGPARVEVADGEISIVVAGVAPSSGVSVGRMLGSRGELTFHLVVADSERMAALCARARNEASVRCESHTWEHPETFAAVHDDYLTGPDREALERFLAEAAAADPALAPEPGRMFLFEHIPPRPFDSDGPRWRTCYVEGPLDVSGANIVDTSVYRDGVASWPAVMLTFDAAGAERVHEVTRTNVGRKLAMVLDDTVTSAPIIQSAIPGGRITITLGDIAPDQREDTARTLAAILRSRRASGERMPVTLELIAAEPIEPTVTREQRVRATLVLALLAGMIAFFLVRLVEIRALPLDVALPGPAGARPWRRLTVTVAAVAIVYAASYVALPGMEELAPFMSENGWGHGSGSVFMLGLMPFLSAFLLVEIVALLVPRWRPLRLSGPIARARLMRATVILGVLLAVLQSRFVASWLAQAMAARALIALPIAAPSTGVLALTMAAGVLVLWILAGLVTRHGLGNGISVILFAGVLNVPESLWSMRQAVPDGLGGGGNIALLVVAVCALVVVTSRVLRTRVGGPLGLRLPTCGIIPVVEAASLPSLSWIIMVAGARTDVAAWMPDEIAPRLALVAVLAMAFSLLLSRPGLLAGPMRVIDAGAAARRANAFWIATVWHG